MTSPTDPADPLPAAPITVVPPPRQADPPRQAGPPRQAEPTGWPGPTGWSGPIGWPAGAPAPPGYRVPPGAYPRPVPTAPNGAPLATFVERLGAYLLDRVIVGGVVAVPAVVLLLIMLLPPFLADVRAQQAAGTEVSTVDVDPLFLRYLLFVVAVFVIQFAVGYFYEVLIQSRHGQTVGKRALKIRTIQLDGSALTRASATRRYLVQFGSGLVPGLSYVDGLWQLWDKPLQQCLHDKVAGTVVIKV